MGVGRQVDGPRLGRLPASRPRIESRVALFSDLRDRAASHQAIGNPLADPSSDFKPLGEMACVKGLRETVGNELEKVGARAEMMDALDGNQPLVVDLKVVFAPSPAAAMAGIAMFFDRNHW